MLPSTFAKTTDVKICQCCQYQFSISMKYGEELGVGMGRYLPDNKIIMLLLGKYGIMCASKQRSRHDA